MRELMVAIVVSAIVVGGALLLPYPLGTSPLPQTIAVQQMVPQTEKPPAAPAQPPAPPAPRHAESTPPPAPVAGGDPEQGRQVYRKCQACHSLEPGKNGIGPTLAGIMGKKAGSEPAYAYS